MRNNSEKLTIFLYLALFGIPEVIRLRQEVRSVLATLLRKLCHPMGQPEGQHPCVKLPIAANHNMSFAPPLLNMEITPI